MLQTSQHRSISVKCSTETCIILFKHIKPIFAFSTSMLVSDATHFFNSTNKVSHSGLFSSASWKKITTRTRRLTLYSGVWDEANHKVSANREARQDLVCAYPGIRISHSDIAFLSHFSLIELHKPKFFLLPENQHISSIVSNGAPTVY